MSKTGKTSSGRRRVAFVLRKLDARAWGGTETHVAAVAEQLAEHGWGVEVHAPSNENNERGRLSEAVPLKRFRAFSPYLGSAETKRALVSNGGNIASLEAAWRLATDPGLALTHAHVMGRLGGAARLAMRVTGRPYVLTVHGPLFDGGAFFDEENQRRALRVLDLGQPLGWLLGARRVVADATRVITFNDAEHDALRSQVGARAVRMDHGVDAARLGSGSAARAARRWPEFGDAPVVAVVGRLCRQKNQLLALRAFAKGAPSSCQLVFAGAETDPGHQRALEAEARSLGVMERVKLLGNLEGSSEVPDLLARATLVLVPSLHESFGLSVLEAWAAGTAVLFAERHGLADIARRVAIDDCSLATLDVEAWASSIARLLSDGARRDRQRSAGCAFVREHYRWEHVGRQLADLYAEVVEESRNKPRPRQGRSWL
jgi:D-inositol-3-phosphate glycosyltransferase